MQSFFQYIAENNRLNEVIENKESELKKYIVELIQQKIPEWPEKSEKGTKVDPKRSTLKVRLNININQEKVESSEVKNTTLKLANTKDKIVNDYIEGLQKEGDGCLLARIKEDDIPV